MRVGAWELIGGIVLIAFGVTLLGGASVLWAKTRRATALLQLLAASVVFVACAIQALALVLTALDHNTLLDTLRTSRVDVAVDVALVAGVLFFSLAYFIDALRQNASNKAMQRTAGRAAI